MLKTTFRSARLVLDGIGLIAIVVGLFVAVMLDEEDENFRTEDDYMGGRDWLTGMSSRTYGGM